MDLILDTNALSALAEGQQNAMRRVTAATRVAVPVIALGEYRFGIAQSRHRAEYERWLEELLPLSEILEISDETSMRYAEIRLELKRAGTPIPSNDLWIAALCRQHVLPVLSQDQHFELVAGLQRLGW